MSCWTLSTTYPKARKSYRCEWCGERIHVGEEHCKSAHIYEGDFQSVRMHLECDHDIICVVRDAYDSEEFSYTPFMHKRGKKEEQQVADKLAGDPNWEYHPEAD